MELMVLMLMMYMFDNHADDEGTDDETHEERSILPQLNVNENLDLIFC